MRFYLIAAALSCTFLGTLVAQAPESKLKLLYPSNRTGDVNIFLINPDGTEPKNLTGHRGQDTFPAWSPDGKKIAFSSDRTGNREIIVMDADGRNAKQLTQGKETNRAPAWSPDGRKIAFCRHLNNNSNPEIFVMDADGANPVNLTNDPAFDADPAWSPDGKKIVFASTRGGQGFCLYVMDADGSNVKPFTSVPNNYGYSSPAWSPDGQRIAFSEPVDQGLEIFACDVDGKSKKQLTKLGGLNTQCAWSPDGKKIAFNHVARGFADGSLYIMEADGSNPTEILVAEAPMEGGRPAWKPK